MGINLSLAPVYIKQMTKKQDFPYFANSIPFFLQFGFLCALWMYLSIVIIYHKKLFKCRWKGWEHIYNSSTTPNYTLRPPDYSISHLCLSRQSFLSTLHRP